MDIYQKLTAEPKDAAAHVHLKYVQRERLAIKRVKEGKDFNYIYNNKPLLRKKDLKRIQELVIPPAWEEVKIAAQSNAHLQAVGYDLKRRLQYRYHDLWMKLRNSTKFLKMVEFGKVLPKLRAQVEEDLELTGWPKPKVMALIVRLMEETHIRIGNEQYAKRNKTYGLSTLRSRHLKTANHKLRFEFTGKKGKKHKVTLNNKKLLRLVVQCEEIPGWELFKFYEENGQKTAVDSSMVNDYIHQIAGEPFTAKDFRTWAGTVVFFESLMEKESTKDEKEIKSNMLYAYDMTAKALGNTRNVCRKYYVHPFIADKYEKKALFESFKKVEQTKDLDYMTAAERVLLDLIKDFDPLKTLAK